MNTFNRTNALTGSAARTLVVIYYGKIVNERYCSFGTALYALSASDTAVGAVFAHVRALLSVVALNDNALGVLDKMNKSVGTYVNADTAAYTLYGIDVGDTVFIYADSRARTSLHTVAVTKTSKGTETVTGKVHVRRMAGFGSCVNIFLFVGVARTITRNVRHSLNHVGSFNAQHRGNVPCGTVATGNTKVGVSLLALGERFCV